MALTHQALVEAKFEELSADHSKRIEAAQMVADDFSPNFYDSVMLALRDLHHADASRLDGSQVLTTLFQLGQQAAGPIDAYLLREAEVSVDEWHIRAAADHADWKAEQHAAAMERAA